MKDDEVISNLLNVWNLSVCPSNAMLGGYLANYIMFYVQRKQKPLHNFLFFDMWNCEALEILMRNEKDEEIGNKLKQQKEKEIKAKNINKMDIDEIDEDDDIQTNGGDATAKTVDISKLSVNKKKNEIVLLDSDDDDENEDIDLTKTDK